MTNESNFAGNDAPPSEYDSSIAELLGTPGDIPLSVQARYFPFINKIMQLGNMTANNIDNILMDNELSRIEEINGKRRYEVRDHASRLDHIKQRSYTEAALSLSRDGMLVKQLTSIHKSISYDDGHNRNTGMLGNLINRRPNDG